MGSRWRERSGLSRAARSVAIAILLAPLARGLSPTARAAASGAAEGTWPRPVAELYREIHRAPNDARLHVELACAYLARGDRERAAVVAQEASALDPALREGWREHLRRMLDEGRLLEAGVAAIELVRLYPGDCSVLALAGRAELARGNPDRGVELLAEATRRCPDRRPSWVARCSKAAARSRRSRSSNVPRACRRTMLRRRTCSPRPTTRGTTATPASTG